MPALVLQTMLPALAGMLAMFAGVLLLRRRRVGWPDFGTRSVLPGWLAITAGFALFIAGETAELGIAFGLLAFSLVAYGVVAAGVQLRSAHRRAPREVPLEPQERRTSLLRGTARAFLAIVLAGIAAIGVGVAFATNMPLGTHDRIVIGGLVVPVLWGAGMAWTLCDSKLLRAAGLLGAVSLLAYGVTFLPKLPG